LLNHFIVISPVYDIPQIANAAQAELDVADRLVNVRTTGTMLKFD